MVIIVLMLSVEGNLHTRQCTLISLLFRC